jgi:spermidine/putrescine transport system ATP-binding protein
VEPTRPAPAPAVEFRHVSKTFDATVAVDRISFAVRAGEFFSLLGPSGCGKTTTLRLIAGFENPDADGGEVLIDGRRVNDLRPYDRGVGMVFQSYALFPHLSVERNVAFGLERHRVPRAAIPGRVRRALELVRLAPDRFAGRMPSQLSGGQRQRVALARALVLEPRILLLDEPLGALDLKLRKEMQLELKALNRSLGITFIYVTHDQEEALTMSDRIAVMSDARIAQLGSPAEVYEDPRTRFVATFIGESNILEGRAEPLAGAPARQEPGQVAWALVRGGARLPMPHHPALGAGGAARIAIRPEWMDLFRPDEVPPGENALPGRVRDVIYLGETIHVLVTLDDGAEVKVAVRNEGQLIKPVPWRAGDRAMAAWLPEDCQVLEPDP